MENSRGTRAWTLIGAAALTLSMVFMARRSVVTPAPEELRDAVASSATPAPAMLGARMVPTNTYFVTPAERRAEAERGLVSSRLTNVSKAMRARAVKLRREAAAERALAVTAQ